MTIAPLICLLLVSAVPRAFAGEAADPFAGVTAAAAPPEAAAPSWAGSFFAENFGFRRELMSQFGFGRNDRPASRQSAGFEALKKFSSETATWAGVDVQVRLVRRDRWVASSNELMGMGRPGWALEYHNLYADLYDPAGRFNLRAGRAYVPFGLNPQTDTHATVLQLSNEENFGFERDWLAGAWGSATRDLDYGAYYLAGSGYDLKYRGQGGLGAARVGLSNRFLSEYGLEGGLSLLGGERLRDGAPVETVRAGADGRRRFPAADGTLTWTTELSGGRDDADAAFTQLHQLEYLRASRRWGLAAQFRRFWKDAPGPAETSAAAEGTWYFRNDAAGSDLHWVKLNVSRRAGRADGRPDWITTLQYYRYW